MTDTVVATKKEYCRNFYTHLYTDSYTKFKMKIRRMHMHRHFERFKLNTTTPIAKQPGNYNSRQPIYR